MSTQYSIDKAVASFFESNTTATRQECDAFAFARGAQPVSAVTPVQLPSIFSGVGMVPLVLTHGDHCEMNILVDPEDGNIMGIVDWAEARTLPFGFTLYGFENSAIRSFRFLFRFRNRTFLHPIASHSVAERGSIRYSVTVNISRFHREARGSIPRTGEHFCRFSIEFLVLVLD